MLRIISAVTLSICAGPALAAEQVLFEIPIEMNRNDETDRAMLVIVGDQINIEEGKPLEFYMLEEGQRADLMVFLDVGDDALNVTDTPTIRKEAVAVADNLAFVLPPQATPKGSLNVITSNGFGNTMNTTETLTVAFRDGEFRVAGWAQDYYNSREDLSIHCSVNYLSGKAVKRKNGGKDAAVQGVFEPVMFQDWSAQSIPSACNGE